MICRYDQSEYLRQKALLDQKYTFQTDPMYSSDYVCQPTAQIDGYHFRLLSIEGDYQEYVEYPKHLTLIACSDQTNEIVYVSFRDDDLDDISSLEELISQDLGWTYVMQSI